MDYRHRDYFLIKTNYTNYAQMHKKYKELCPSIKYHSAREFDFWWKPETKDKYPWLIFHPQEMVSVKKEESAKLVEYITDWEIYDIETYEYHRTQIRQITKKELGQ